tara:strand:+ start:461 stop:667 length:207 start_codon:yes stop_codon:yes gene_type:complete
MTNYKIVKSNNSDDLMKAVNRHLKDGCIPVGGITVKNVPLTNEIELYQAITLTDNSDDYLGPSSDTGW